MLGYRRAERQDGSFAICADGAERIPGLYRQVVDTVGAW